MANSPSAARARFGADLRRFRERAGLTQKDLARAVPMSQSHVSGIELGQKGTSEEQISRIDQMLTCGGSLLNRWRTLFRGGGFPDWFRDVADLQTRAAEIRDYDPLLVPGLLQTPEYAETLVRLGRPTASNEAVKKLVTARMDRQELLNADHPPWYVAILDEPWLHRPIGSHAIMKGQLDHLLKVAQWSRVTVQVIPTATKLHPGIDGAFQWLAAPGEGEFVFTESRAAGHLTSDPDVVSDYTRVFGELRGVALPAEASQDLIARIAESFHVA